MQPRSASSRRVGSGGSRRGCETRPTVERVGLNVADVEVEKKDAALITQRRERDPDIVARWIFCQAIGERRPQLIHPVVERQKGEPELIAGRDREKESALGRRGIELGSPLVRQLPDERAPPEGFIEPAVERIFLRNDREGLRVRVVGRRPRREWRQL